MHYVRVSNREALGHLEEGGLIKVAGVDLARAEDFSTLDEPIADAEGEGSNQ